MSQGLQLSTLAFKIDSHINGTKFIITIETIMQRDTTPTTLYEVGNHVLYTQAGLVLQLT
jgi:hypothetical protein